jgi:hypothetical protein
MREIVIQIPTADAEQKIEIDVRINGDKKTLHYRVEIIRWEDKAKVPQERVSLLKRVIRERASDWDLVQIGVPTEDNVPVMFRKREESAVEADK